ncbi:glycosyltransferase [Echinicola jeungdonensis]|uniref:Glycosyltransferase family 4 protein n=1 Tax=Echinicola jeungdonensis TaxID=709343 RepID=A0ABV5J336_9BACT|nr:glycosyltransferase [Echinicola jeungdonensis]MDN3668471.1 glycosyltransferase [Echinicola jeungdonensis]
MKIAYISTYLPRKCGIATFNDNLEKALRVNFPDQSSYEKSFGIAVHDGEEIPTGFYPDHVKAIFRENYQQDYIQAANFINTSEAQVVVMEHEFGIFGGESGIYILPLLNRLEKPLFTILHTVLKEPSHTQKLIIQEIAACSAGLVVMSLRGMQFLKSVYGIPSTKIHYIEHGVPDLEAPENNPLTKTPPFLNHRVLLTFGLLSPNKGLETVIEALPKIVAQYPDVMYVVLGKTHPGILKNTGEEYRDQLKRLAVRLGVENHLTFVNKFVTDEELINYLTAAHIYVTPYLNEAQITSGTLSYAVGAGAAIVSTPYWHALELLDEQRGCLFRFKDAEGLADTINNLLDQPQKRNSIKKNAYDYGLHLRWPKIGAQYIRILQDAIDKEAFTVKKIRQIVDPDRIPAFSLIHARRLTDGTGIVQHAKYGIPNLKEGYCLDDNARALIMALMAYQRNKSQEALELIPIYLSFIHYMQRKNGNFGNFLSFRREYLDEIGSEDAFGRTIWSLGFLVNCAPNNSYREFAGELFYNSVPHFKDLHHLRGMANTIIGISYFLKSHPDNEEMLRELNELTSPLLNAYYQNCRKDWNWFEEKLTYDNAILPLALFHSCEITGNNKVREIAFESLKFLDKLSFRDGFLSPVGNRGWYYRDQEIQVFDQQAIETMAMVLMYLKAYENSHHPSYIERMFKSYQWFLGENILRVPLYDHETKGCCDGLQETALNRNQGAESTLAYLISNLTVLKALEMEHEYDHAVTVEPNNPKKVL